MSSVIISGDTSGSVILQAPAIAGSTTLTLPATSGTVVVTSGSQTIEFADGSASAPSITNSGDTNTGIFFPAADTIAFTEGGTESMRIDSSGNVLTGGLTSSPGQADPNSTAGQIVALNTKRELRWNNTNASIYGGSGGADDNLYYYSGNSHIFRTSATERMRITSTGNVGIGNDNPTGYNNAFTAITTSSYLPLFVGNTNTSATGAGVIIAKWLNSNATSNILMQFLINGVATGSGQINANGASAAAFGSYSDERLKENIKPLPSQLDNILALKPSEFDYKDGAGHQIGFIAQEMQEVYPDVVSVGENDMLTITGWDKTSARLVKAIQEQQTIINNIKAELDNVKTELATLKGAA